MKKIQLLALCATVAGVLSSCQKEEITEEIVTETVPENLSNEHQTALIDAAVNPLNAEYTTLKSIDGSSIKGIKSGDIFLRLDKLSEYSLKSASGSEKQYRTTNLVNQNSTINVVGYTGSGYALTSVMQTGLQYAINNYNNENISLTFNLTFSSSTSGADIVIFNGGGTDAGAVAEFPSGGNPGFWIEVYGGMNSYNDQINEHLMTHEIGHAIGFRHTDYANRKCDGSNEGFTEYGALFIPGTPSVNQWGASGLDTDSIMISCFSGNEDGEFSYYDSVALEYLY
ncbi:hypothetical protein GCM10022393_09190 [Aquimarina addita]|uniref:Dual-action HEIGH metallo-peptidase n=1 Tax=Aquimarina addita TaxID=870485 RepID=A0ABP7XCF7_9FLAO